MHAEIDRLLTTIGPAIGAAEIRQHGDALWVLAFDEDFAISVEVDVERDVMVLEADLGTPAPDRELDLCKLLLRAAAAWRETGGLRMGLDPLDDVVVQQLDVPLDGLEPDAACLTVQRFIAAARTGQAFVTSLDERDADAASTGMYDHFLRA